MLTEGYYAKTSQSNVKLAALLPRLNKKKTSLETKVTTRKVSSLAVFVKL